MTGAGPMGPERFRLLAGFLAGRPVDVAQAQPGQRAHTDGAVIFVSAAGSVADQRREVLVQSALIGAGSLDPRLVMALRARPPVARRYLAVEGRRVLADVAARVPLAAALRPDGEPRTQTADESLEIARGRGHVDEAPEWFGAIRPALLLKTPPPETGGQAPLRFAVPEIAGSDEAEDDDQDDGPTEKSKILRLFESPLAVSQIFADFLGKLLGTSPAPGDDHAGGELPIRSVRRTRQAGPYARPLPTRIHFSADGDPPGAALGVGGALHPEWDVHQHCYRPDWCRVVQFPLTAAEDVSLPEATAVPRDDVLRRRLSRIGLGIRVLRGRPDGDELDLEALVDLCVDLRSGWSPPEHVYADRRRVERDLGVLILLDTSGSVTDSDPDGLAVHDHQRRAAATLAATLEELGDRVAVYAFRSQGRHAVHLAAVKTFGQRFGATARTRLAQLRPSGYTRLGAAIRGAGEILKSGAGTPNRLLVVLSDGFPYDDGYEGRYAEADTNRALDELRADGVACLCLSIGAEPTTDTLERVFGAAGHARAATLAELSPRMDELFLSALQELRVSRPGWISST
ncbi:nitric oxide reductase activation protein NorD [Mycolicibacterium litorale]|uniref:nitric oxide reductase activation protein NorD n=1 Tax=Mycolicibacterium litorale TaxID=758802 RepID=UPI003CF8440F